MIETDRELLVEMLQLRADYLDDLGRREEAEALRTTDVTEQTGTDRKSRRSQHRSLIRAARMLKASQMKPTRVFNDWSTTTGSQKLIDVDPRPVEAWYEVNQVDEPRGESARARKDTAR